MNGVFLIWKMTIMSMFFQLINNNMVLLIGKNKMYFLFLQIFNLFVASN